MRHPRLRRSAADASAFWRDRGRRLMGSPDPALVFAKYHDFIDGAPGWTRQVSTGIVRLDNSSSSHHGWYDIRTGSGAGSVPRLDWTDNSGATFQFTTPGGVNAAWYMFFRGDFNAGVDTAQTRGGMAIREPGGTILAVLGKIPGLGNWGFSASVGSTIDTGVAVDTNVHEFEAVRFAGVTYVYVDRILRASAAGTYPGAAGHISLIMENGAEAAVRQVLVDSVCVAGAGRTVYA